MPGRVHTTIVSDPILKDCKDLFQIANTFIFYAGVLGFQARASESGHVQKRQ